MAPSVFRKVRQRLNRSREAVPLNHSKELPPPYDIVEALIPSPEKLAAEIESISTTNSEGKPEAIVSTNVKKNASRAWLHAASEPSYTSEPIELITEKSIPQWRWPNSHVKIWLMAVLTTDMGLSLEQATEIVDMDMGIGANLYCRTEVYWTSILDEDTSGKMYAKIMSLREKDGAVPDFCHVRRRKVEDGL